MIRNLTLRHVALSDAPALREKCWSDIALPDAQLRLQTLMGMPEGRERAWGFVALIEDELVAFGQMTRWGTRGEICNLIVSEEWRNQGIGTAIIQRLIGVARENALHDVEIGAAEANPRALALYRRLGFRDGRHVSVDLGHGMEPVVYLLLDLGTGICEA